MIIRIFLLLLIFYSELVFSYETDQYSVPEGSLADIGEDLSQFIYSRLKSGILQLNSERKEIPLRIIQLESELAKFQVEMMLDLPSSDYPPQQAYKKILSELTEQRGRLKSLNSEFGIISFLHATYSGTITWNEQRDGVFGIGLNYINQDNNIKAGVPILFNHEKLSTIYSFSGFHRIISPSYFVFASTMKAYGIMMGVDKFGHFINQGYEYFQIYDSALKNNLNSGAAYKKMVSWGVDTEDGLFGAIVDGVYSNADLAANLAGFIFYQNMFKNLTIAGEFFPQIIKINANDDVEFNEVVQNSEKNLLKRFFSDHFDESLNPSQLESPQRGIVKMAIKNRCEKISSVLVIDQNQELIGIITTDDLISLLLTFLRDDTEKKSMEVGSLFSTDWLPTTILL